MYLRRSQISGDTKSDYSAKTVVAERQHHSRRYKRINKQIYAFKDINKPIN